MSNQQYQKIFKRSIVERMRENLRSGASLKSYFQESYPVKDEDLLDSTIKTVGNPPVLKAPKEDPVATDLDNAIALHEYYGNIDETQASDPRLWAYLSHVEFRKYALVRWGAGESYDELEDDEARQKAIRKLLEHWFVGANDRDLRRHAIARLWWAAHLTYAPWERDSEFFADLKSEDPYKFTRILLLTQDIYQQVLERAMGRSDRILISVLEYLGNHQEFATSREKVRGLIKELNLVYGTKKIITLDRNSLKQAVEELASGVDGTVANEEEAVAA